MPDKFGVRQASPTKLVIAGIVALVVLIGGYKMISSVAVHLDAGQVMIVQSPFAGTLTCYDSPGLKQLWFGKATKYNKRSQFWFSAKKDQGQAEDQSIRVMFNDNGHANISGSLSWDMPTDCAHLTALHTQYGSQEAIEQQLIRTVIEKAVYMTGPLMSSKESSAERRTELLQDIQDQVDDGIYLVHTETMTVKDPITGEQKPVNVAKVVLDRQGRPLRSAPSPLTGFGYRTFNPSINDIHYSDDVAAQIAQQQKLTMQVQTSIAEARQAEQRAITVAKQGEADAAKAKWDQEVIKAKAVTEAQQKLEVAQLEAQAADQYRIKKIHEAEGDAEYKRRVMAADGALAQKLDAWVRVNGLYAGAIKDHQGSWVPLVVNGGGSANQSGGAQNLIDLWTLSTAKQLGLNMGMETGGVDKKPN